MARTVTHSKFQSYSLRLQYIIYKNGLHKYYIYTIAQIKLHFCEIASPWCRIHWLYLDKELLAAQPQLWLKQWFKSYSLRLQYIDKKNALNKCHVYIMVHIKLYFGGIASPEGGVHWLLLKSFAWLPNLVCCGWDILAGDHPNSEEDASFLAPLFMPSLFNIEMKCVL